MSDNKNLADNNNNDKVSSIMVPIDEDSVDVNSSPDTVDELSMELATLIQSAKRIAIIGSRKFAIAHQ